MTAHSSQSYERLENKPSAGIKSEEELARTSVNEAHVGWTEHVSFFLLGMGPWMVVNSIWAELPFYMNETPEGYNIASRLALAIQIANGVAMGVLFVQKWWRKRSGKGLIYRLGDRVMLPYVGEITFIFVLGILLFIGLMVADTRTADIDGHNMSVVLILLTFGAGAIGCLSTVTLWTFISSFPPVLLVSMSAGMGFSGVPPSILSVIQSPDSAHRFSRKVFYALHAFMMAVALVNFLHIRFNLSEKHRLWMVENYVREEEEDGVDGDEEYAASSSSSSNGRGDKLKPVVTSSDGLTVEVVVEQSRFSPSEVLTFSVSVL